MPPFQATSILSQRVHGELQPDVHLQRGRCLCCNKANTRCLWNFRSELIMDKKIKRIFSKYIDVNKIGDAQVKEENYTFCIIKLSDNWYMEENISSLIQKVEQRFVWDSIIGAFIVIHAKENVEDDFFKRIINQDIKILIIRSKTKFIFQGTSSNIKYAPLLNINDEKIKEFLELPYGKISELNI